MKSRHAVFWDMTPCSPLKINRHFGGTYHLHLQGSSACHLLSPWLLACLPYSTVNMEAVCASETPVDFSGLYAVVSQKTQRSSACHLSRWFLAWLIYSSTVKMEAVSSSETSVDFSAYYTALYPRIRGPLHATLLSRSFLACLIIPP
jgi:hypothetical protein